VAGHVLIALWIAVFLVASLTAGLGPSGGSGVHWDSWGASAMKASLAATITSSSSDARQDEIYRDLAGVGGDGIRPAPRPAERFVGAALAAACLAVAIAAIVMYPYLIVLIFAVLTMGVGVKAGYVAPSVLAVRRTRRG